jgi:hypothetical protein
MLDELRKTVEVLSNPRTGWVSRRDAAETLGKAAGLAIMALRQFEREQDVDVQHAVVKAIDEVQHSLKNAHSGSLVAKEMSLGELVKATEKPGKREISIDGDGFAIHVQLPNGRKQTVYAAAVKDREGNDAIRLMSVCCPLTQDVYEKALRANSTIVHGALAAGVVNGETRLILVRFLEVPDATPGKFKAAVKQVAFHTDWMEQKLAGSGDAF